MKNFLQALEELDRLDPKDAFAQIFRFFDAINRMDKETVIAAYQTLTLFCRKTTGSKDTMWNDTSDLNDVRKALIGRMNVLASEIPPQRRNSFILGMIAATGLAEIWFANVAILES